jgi:hypothetical protein
VQYYDHDNLWNAVDVFVKNNPGPFLVFDFAVQSRIYIERLKFDKDSEAKFKYIVEQTKKRMESE